MRKPARHHRLDICLCAIGILTMLCACFAVVQHRLGWTNGLGLQQVQSVGPATGIKGGLSSGTDILETTQVGQLDSVFASILFGVGVLAGMAALLAVTALATCALLLRTDRIRLLVLREGTVTCTPSPRTLCLAGKRRRSPWLEMQGKPAQPVAPGCWRLAQPRRLARASVEWFRTNPKRLVDRLGIPLDREFTDMLEDQ